MPDVLIISFIGLRLAKLRTNLIVSRNISASVSEHLETGVVRSASTLTDVTLKVMRVEFGIVAGVTRFSVLVQGDER